MEPRAAVDLILKNPELKKAGVRVTALVADKDSSTMAALNRESPYRIRKVVDLNHEIKSVGNSIYKLKELKGHKFLTKRIVDYLKRCLSYAITGNAGDVEGVRRAILNITPHTYNENDGCSEVWCHAINKPSYKYKDLPDVKPFTDPHFRRDIAFIFEEES